MKEIKNRHKVVVRLMGGLGNQMFQFATGFALAQRLNTSCFIDLHYYSKDVKKSKDTRRNFELDVFENSYTTHSTVLSNSLVYKLIAKFSVLKKQILPKLNIFYYTDVDDLASACLTKQKGTYYLDGYWPNFLFFDQYRNEIKSRYGHLRVLDEADKRLLKILKNQNTVAIHIRRSDYLKNNSIHKALELGYYKKAIDYIRERVENPLFYFFGDDHRWILENFDIDNVFNTLVSNNTGSSSHKDLFLMSQCNHIVISNSTFSWWAAYLNNNNDSIVIAPTEWYLKNQPSYFDADKLLPRSWIKI
jgi:hypothetical protein